MKSLLFCQNQYAFGILKPLCEKLVALNHEVLWYIPSRIYKDYPGKSDYDTTDSMIDLVDFSPEVIFVPGNEVPYWLPGVKVQIFHGFAGEKKGHFRIRHYFDLYLTQGPYFTYVFNKLAKKHHNFEVVETGWCKLDPYFNLSGKINNEKTTGEKSSPTVILYAPTFSPYFTSAVTAHDQIVSLARDEGYRVIVKFHDLTDPEIIERYRQSTSETDNLTISEESNILPVMVESDIMISDTSSAVYEYLILDKPVITIASNSPHIRWSDITDPSMLKEAVADLIRNDSFAEERRWIVDNYHPYNDGASSERMIKAVEDFISRNGIPVNRKLSMFRRNKIHRLFGRKPISTKQ